MWSPFACSCTFLRFCLGLYPPTQGILLTRTVDCVVDASNVDTVRYDMQCTTSSITRRNLNITLLVSLGIVVFVMVRSFVAAGSFCWLLPS